MPKVDYENEVSALGNSANVFKPEAGSYNIVVLAEPENCVYVDKESGEETPQIRLSIEVEKEQKTWYVSKGKTFNSVYGQLMLLGKSKGKLTGVNFILLVKRGKDKNEYTIPEAVVLMPREEKVA